MKLKPNKTVIERFLMPNPEWQEGYRTFNKAFGNPLGWLYLVEEDGRHRLIRLDRKGKSIFVCPHGASPVRACFREPMAEGPCGYQRPDEGNNTTPS